MFPFENLWFSDIFWGIKREHWEEMSEMELFLVVWRGMVSKILKNIPHESLTLATYLFICIEWMFPL